MKFNSIIAVFVIAGSLHLTASPILAQDSGLDSARQRELFQFSPPQLAAGATSISRAPAGSVQVNVDSFGRNIIGDAANEPSIAADPTSTPIFDPSGRPSRIAIGWRQFDSVASNFRQAGYAFTINGGANWSKRVLAPGSFRTDPVLVADNSGRLFFNSLVTDSGLTEFCVDVWKSNFGASWLTGAGLTWCCPATAFAGDKAWMAIDRRGSGSPGSGNLYCNWTAGTGCDGTPAGTGFTRSTDHGDSWMTPIAIPNAPFWGTVAVGADGAVYVAGRPTDDNRGSAPLTIAKSVDALNPTRTPTWAFSIKGNFLGGPPASAGSVNPGGLLGQVWVATHPVFSSHVFLLCSVDPPGGDPLDIMFSRSSDGGRTWGPPVRVSDDVAFGAFQWFGTMSVAPNGRIDVVWNDTRDDSRNILSRTYYSFSLNEGTTWSRNRALTPGWDSRRGFPQQAKIGDYYHMISDNAGASLAYAATFNGEQDIYFTRIVPDPFELLTTGSFELAPTAPTVAVHDRLDYAFTWTVPVGQNWHDLRELHFLVRDLENIILLVRFNEADQTFSVFNEDADRFSKAEVAGSKKKLHTKFAELDLAGSTVVASGPTGPTVTLNLALNLKPMAAGRTYTVEVSANDDFGNADDFAAAGTLTVTEKVK